MKKFSFLLFVLIPLLYNTSGAQESVLQKKLDQTQLKSGDLIFQNLSCGPLCDAINAVTQGYADRKFSHMGMVYFKGDSILIIEAAGKDVHLSPLNTFLSKSKDSHLVGRLKPSYTNLIPQAIAFSLKHMGDPYDDQYLYNNGKYYCSELIYDAFKSANADQPVFTMFPMTYKQPGSTAFFPVWQAYFNKIGIPVPEGQPGCNPGGISLSDKIEMLGVL